MGLTPRANEVSTVSAILDSDDFETVDDMSRAVVRALGAELSRRETYMIVPGHTPYAYGPYWTVKEAERAWTAHLGPALGGEARLLRSVSWNRDEGSVQATDCECSHAVEQHVVRNLRGGKVSGPTDCGVFVRREKCPCKGYTRRSA